MLTHIGQPAQPSTVSTNATIRWPTIRIVSQAGPSSAWIWEMSSPQAQQASTGFR